MPHTKVTVKTSKHSKKTRSAPLRVWCGSTPPMKYPTAVTPPNMAATYAATMPAKPIHLPSKICQREIGFVAMAWMVPEAISPESVSTEVRIVMTTASRSTA